MNSTNIVKWIDNRIDVMLRRPGAYAIHAEALDLQIVTLLELRADITKRTSYGRMVLDMYTRIVNVMPTAQYVRSDGAARLKKLKKFVTAVKRVPVQRKKK